MGIGYETVESLLQDAHFSVRLLVLLLFTKLALTAISLGSGFVGGIFAPAIFLGAILGSAYGQALGLVLPNFIPVAAPPAYALVGMAAVLAGTVRAPLTAVLLLFEMTRDYRIVLPLMASVGLCAWLVEQLQSGQISALGAKKTANAEDVGALSTIKIAEVMSVQPLTFKYSTPILQAAQIFTSGYFHSALVVDDSHHLLGILTTQDIERALSLPKLSQNFNKLTVQEVCTKEVLYTFADESLADAIRRMAARDLQQLPVVDRNSTSRVVGMVDRQAITSAYTNALTKQAIADKIASNKAESPHIIEPKEAEISSSPIEKEISSSPIENKSDDMRAEALTGERTL
jgi:CBS domain-containing protein